MTADLVVDASGRGSRTPQWLEELGYPRPRESVINVNVGYSTRFYRRPPGAGNEWRVLLVYPTPPAETRLGVIFPVEENRWMATLAGWIGDHPPDDEEGYLKFARSLSTLDFYNAVNNAEPLSPIVTHKFPSNLRRHYENLDRFPEGLVVLGDALCSFNPVYGQGMTTSAMAASILGECLDWRRKGGEDSAAMTRRFRKMSHKAVDVAWMIAASEDFRYPAVGRASLSTNLINRYFHRVHELGSCDPETHRRFLQVMTMIKPASTIFHPRVIWRVLTSRLPHKPNFEYFPRNPDSARIFDEAMTGLSASEVGAILGAYDFSKYKKIIDVAGGNGSLIIPLLKISLATLPASLIDSLDQRRRPPFDLVWCNTVPALRMAEQGHCNPLSEELAPNLKDLAARARPAQAPIEGFSPFVSPYVVHYVMAYREEAFPHGKPDSWEVMPEPGYKGKVALYPGGNGFFPIAQAMGGGSPDGIPNNMTPCWEFFHRLKPQVGHLGYSIGMGDLIRKGELDICFRALTNAIAFKDEGLAVSWVAPKEGITDTADALWIPRGVPDDVVFWSQRYINTVTVM